MATPWNLYGTGKPVSLGEALAYAAWCRGTRRTDRGITWFRAWAERQQRYQERQ